jgi:parallel beta-helix repeat protein
MAHSRSAVRWICVLGAIVLGCRCLGATYYVDPVAGAMTGDGSAAKPWSTLEKVMASRQTFRAGDVLMLREGNHGHPVIRGAIAGGEVIVRAADGQHPVLAALTFRSAEHWTVEGLTVTPEGAERGKRHVAALIAIAGDCREIKVDRCDVFSARSIAGWTEADWLDRSVDGISSSGERCTIADNTLRNVRFGIVIGAGGRDSTILRNTISDFMSDGLRGLADDCVFEGNVVKNCYKIDDNHDDGFQSWSIGEDGKVGRGVVKHVVLRGNTFISYTDPNQPFKAAMQGIGCFDGMFEGWVVENNLVVTDMWHGIAFYGATNCRIVNNTVLKNPIDAAPRTPWIQISPHKHGAASTGNLVRNNLVQTLHATPAVGTVDHNVVLTDVAAAFDDYRKFDFHLKPGSLAVDAGDVKDAPKTDLDGHPREGTPDAGAYELTTK